MRVKSNCFFMKFVRVSEVPLERISVHMKRELKLENFHPY